MKLVGMVHKGATINIGKRKKCSPMVELHDTSVPDRVAAGMKCFRAAFPHDYHFALEDYKVDDTDCRVLES